MFLKICKLMKAGDVRYKSRGVGEFKYITYKKYLKLGSFRKNEMVFDLNSKGQVKLFLFGIEFD